MEHTLYYDTPKTNGKEKGGLILTRNGIKRTNRHYIGFELDKKYFDLTNERIRMEKQALRLF